MSNKINFTIAKPFPQNVKPKNLYDRLDISPRFCHTWYIPKQRKDMTQTLADPMLQPYYSCDLSISIVNIDAENKHHAEAIMQKFIDEIAKVMDKQVRWHEADWEITENVYSPEYDIWFEQ